MKATPWQSFLVGPAIGLALGFIILASASGCTFKQRTEAPPPPVPVDDAGLPVFDGSILERGTAGEMRGPCTGLRCQQSSCTVGPCTGMACTGGVQTTVKGRVFDPAGKVPLYGVNVYVPNAALSPLSEGASCDCETSLSGDPLVREVTDANGDFILKDVPAGANIPLVIQVGKWRREVTIPMVTACTETVADMATTRLPRNKTEGHIPKIALTTGGLDALECLLRKIGIEDSEFTPETADGRVNLFAGGLFNGAPDGNNSPGTNGYDATLNGGAMFTDASVWWESVDNLNKYDIILHSCEGLSNPRNKSVAARAALKAYADAGGRVFASHWHNYWIEFGAAPWPTVARFSHQNDPQGAFTTTIDTGFPKGLAMSAWLTNVGASTTPGQLTIMGAKRTVAVVNMPAGQRWMYNPMPESVQYFSFNAPVGEMRQCGKVVFSDLHVSSGSGAATDDKSNPTLKFPTGCMTTDLSPQEKALEFMLFDLSTCVSDIPIL
ncbi:MAG: carboxypeptidase regulatory-like domain-containing protein [Pseudomonadota bacterium]